MIELRTDLRPALEDVASHFYLPSTEPPVAPCETTQPAPSPLSLSSGVFRVEPPQPIEVKTLPERALAIDPTAPFTAVSRAQRQWLYDKVANATFVGADDAIYRVPHHYPDGQCFLRGHLSAMMMMEEGVNPAKIFAISRDAHGYDRLRVRTDYAPDMPVPEPPAVSWAFHTAAAVYGDDEDGRGFWVVDPATQSGPVRSQKWLDDISNGVPLEYWPFEQVQRHRFETGGIIAPGDAYHYYTDARALVSRDAATINSLAIASSGVRNCLSDLTRYAKVAEVRELAAVGRRVLRGERSATALSAAATPYARDNFQSAFPLLSGALQMQLGRGL